MDSHIIWTIVIVLFGYLFVRRLAHLMYYNKNYKEHLDRKFNIDDIIEEKNEEDEKKKEKDSKEASEDDQGTEDQKE
ncbi:MAG TPA: hypothetical protein DHN33_10195 [Eubacteriaceae bacterium]|nr:hypothetical protein [Eubacteriaceae bacterium]